MKLTLSESVRMELSTRGALDPKYRSLSDSVYEAITEKVVTGSKVVVFTESHRLGRYVFDYIVRRVDFDRDRELKRVCYPRAMNTESGGELRMAQYSRRGLDSMRGLDMSGMEVFILS